MLRFQNPNGLQVIPRSYYGTLPNGEKFRIVWNNAIQSWESFYATVRSTLSANSVTNLPSEADVMDFICRHVPQGCVGDPPDFTPVYTQHNTGECSSCGKQF